MGLEEGRAYNAAGPGMVRVLFIGSGEVGRSGLRWGREGRTRVERARSLGARGAGGGASTGRQGDSRGGSRRWCFRPRRVRQRQQMSSAQAVAPPVRARVARPGAEGTQRGAECKKSRGGQHASARRPPGATARRSARKNRMRQRARAAQGEPGRARGCVRREGRRGEGKRKKEEAGGKEEGETNGGGLCLFGALELGEKGRETNGGDSCSFGAG
jgi:hypothetical protein